MILSWKAWRPWVKWFVGVAGSTLLIFIVLAVVLYVRITSINMGDIQLRHALSSAPSASPNAILPSYLSGSLEKANQFADKPIESQDALDIAAIVLKSGLSMRDIGYLTGKVSDELSTEEKQKIRDLLLAKLSQAEVDALRSITTKYGKYLVIVDPNYPIELVGVQDEAKRARIMKELEGRKQAQQVTASPIPSPTPVAAAVTVSPSVAPATPEAVEHPTPTESGEMITTRYQSQLDMLQASCTTEANRLLAEITKAIITLSNSGEGTSADTEVQLTYLTQITQAEQRCDERFEVLVIKTKDELQQKGFDFSIVDSWRQSYAEKKNALRVQAITQLSEQLRKKTTP